MLANNLNTNTSDMNNVNSIINTNYTTKKILEMSCYIRIERNGIEIKFKNTMSNSPCKVIINEIISQNNALRKQNEQRGQVNVQNVTFMITIKNINNEELISFDVRTIMNIIDKLIDEGKLTIVINHMNDKMILFVHKTSKLILENFIQHVKRLKTENNDGKNSNNNNNTMEIKNCVNSSIQNLNSVDALNKKRKIKDLYKQATKFESNGVSSNNLQIKKFKKNTEFTKYIPIISKLNFLDLPCEIKGLIYDYLDTTNIWKISLLCKECKNDFDNSYEKLKFRNDTPPHIFSVLMKRFLNIKYLDMGKGKFIKNEIFKYFDVSLKSLEMLDISQITNLNDESVRKLLSKTKSDKIKSIKLNFFLDSLSTALFYILEFYQNLFELEITNSTSLKMLNNTDALLKSLEKEPRCFHPNIYRVICELINTKKYLRKLNVSILNVINIHIIILSRSLFNSLENLSIDILIIEKLKDLYFLTSACNLKALTIKEILLGKKTDTFKLTQFDFAAMTVDESTRVIIDLENPEDHLDNLCLDFSHDYIEFFSNIFYKLRRLIKINFGSFVNKDIMKIISINCKEVEEMTINSNRIEDDCIKNILTSLPRLHTLDLRGCEGIQGSCFLDINPWPENIKRIKLSVTNYNFYTLIEYLRSKGVDAQNYLLK